MTPTVFLFNNQRRNNIHWVHYTTSGLSSSMVKGKSLYMYTHIYTYHTASSSRQQAEASPICFPASLSTEFHIEWWGRCSSHLLLVNAPGAPVKEGTGFVLRVSMACARVPSTSHLSALLGTPCRTSANVPKMWCAFGYLAMIEMICCARPRATTMPRRLTMIALSCALATGKLRVTAA